ncbi:HAD family hydrolase [Roseibium sp. RKSG952]|uniref:HAD family hydrolase n=1 Tax=Roseibium sp. RKSG952 TaxID=2529384 RepID=UPI0034CEEB38
MKNVIFDIGNVLIEWNPELLYRKLLPDPAKRHAFLRDVCTMDWNIQQDLGRSWAEAVAALSREHPDKTGLIAAYSDRWQEMVPGEIPGSVGILETLRQSGVPLYAITNFSSEKFAETEVRFPFLKTHFLDVVVSAHERLVKPDPRIYEVLLSRNGLTAEDCVFIDDSLPNVNAARTLGMAAIHFQTAEDLRRDLQEMGFLNSAAHA